MPSLPKGYDVKLFIGLRKHYGGKYMPPAQVKREVLKDTGLGFTVYPAVFEMPKDKKTYKERTLVFERMIPAKTDGKPTGRAEISRIENALQLIKQHLHQEDILESVEPIRSGFR